MLTIRTLFQRLAAVCGVLVLVTVLFAGHCQSGPGLRSQTPNLYVVQEGSVGDVPSVARNVHPALTGSGVASVLVFPLTASGDVAPTTTISGANTDLQGSSACAFDASGNLYVTDITSNSVTVYAAGASGDVAPISTISGANTLLNNPEAVVLDSKGNIYVANFGTGGASSGSVTIFSAGANGDVAPLSTITGSNTNFGSPDGIALDAAGKIYVANVNGVGITVYAAGATGNVAPVATISGSNTGINSAAGVALDATGNIYVVNSTGPSVTVYAPGTNGNIAPIATISGSSTTLVHPIAVALDALANIYVSDNQSSSVLIFAAGAHGNIAPAAVISGANTGFASLRGVTVH